MKLILNRIKEVLFAMPALFICFMLLPNNNVQAQDSTNAEEPAAPVKVKPLKNSFKSIWIIDNP